MSADRDDLIGTINELRRERDQAVATLREVGRQGQEALTERDLLSAKVERVRKLHEPQPTTLVAKGELFGEVHDIEPDSFEEIVSRDVNCMACAGYPTAPCETVRILDGDQP